MFLLRRSTHHIRYSKLCCQNRSIILNNPHHVLVSEQQTKFKEQQVRCVSSIFSSILNSHSNANGVSNIKKEGHITKDLSNNNSNDNGNPSERDYKLAQHVLDKFLHGRLDGKRYKRKKLAYKNQVLNSIPELKRHELDCGSTEVQIARLSGRIQHLSEHVKMHAKDHATNRIYQALLYRRQKLLKYLKGRSIDRFNLVLEKIDVRERKSLDTIPKGKKKKKSQKAARLAAHKEKKREMEHYEF